MDLKVYYKTIWDDVYAYLKPLGFRRRGITIYRITEEGVIHLIEMQKSQFNTEQWSRFTMNVGMSVTELPVDVKKMHYYIMQMQMNLGCSLDDGWNQQFWYNVSMPDNWKELDFLKDKHMTLDEIHSSVLMLVQNKAMPLFDSVITKEDYFKLFNENYNQYDGNHIRCMCGIKQLEELGSIYGKRMIPIFDSFIDQKKTAIEEMQEEGIEQWQIESMQEALESMINIRKIFC